MGNGKERQSQATLRFPTAPSFVGGFSQARCRCRAWSQVSCGRPRGAGLEGRARGASRLTCWAVPLLVASVAKQTAWSAGRSCCSAWPASAAVLAVRSAPPRGKEGELVAVLRDCVLDCGGESMAAVTGTCLPVGKTTDESRN